MVAVTCSGDACSSRPSGATTSCQARWSSALTAFCSLSRAESAARCSLCLGDLAVEPLPLEQRGLDLRNDLAGAVEQVRERRRGLARRSVPARLVGKRRGAREGLAGAGGDARRRNRAPLPRRRRRAAPRRFARRRHDARANSSSRGEDAARSPSWAPQRKPGCFVALPLLGNDRFSLTERLELAQAPVAVRAERGETAHPLGLAAQAVGHLVGGAHPRFVGGQVVSRALARLLARGEGTRWSRISPHRTSRSSRAAARSCSLGTCPPRWRASMSRVSSSRRASGGALALGEMTGILGMARPKRREPFHRFHGWDAEGRHFRPRIDRRDRVRRARLGRAPRCAPGRPALERDVLRAGHRARRAKWPSSGPRRPAPAGGRRALRRARPSEPGARRCSASSGACPRATWLPRARACAPWPAWRHQSASSPPPEARPRAPRGEGRPCAASSCSSISTAQPRQLGQCLEMAAESPREIERNFVEANERFRQSELRSALGRARLCAPRDVTPRARSRL